MPMPNKPILQQQPTRLRAGPLELVYEDGRIHSISAGGVEIWRSVVFLFRDPAWATPWHEAANVQIHQTAQTFEISHNGACPQHPAIEWKAHIQGTADGCIRFDVVASVLEDTLTSRVGLCVLHPLHAAGAALEVEHADGRVSRSSFPLLVSPWQPFTQIRALRHLFAPGCWATCRMHGDVFEMEDQRGFSDASFKTYSRSNLMPRPYRLTAGETIRQSVTLHIDKAPKTPLRRSNGVARVVIGGSLVGKLPSIGVITSAHAAAGSTEPDFWHLQLDLRGAPPAPLRAYLGCPSVGHTSGKPVRMDVLLDGDEAAADVCSQLAAALRDAGITVSAVAVYPTTARSLASVRQAFPGACAGGGTPFFFTQLNRLDLPLTLDFVAFSTCPIVHMADDLSVMQTLATLPALVNTLRARAINCPLHVGPIGIGMPLDPFSAQVRPMGEKKLAMAPADARDGAAFGCAWAFAYLCQMAHAGAEAVTFGHGHVLARLKALTALAHAPLPSLTISAPEQLAALAVSTHTGLQAWVANLTDQPRPARLIFSNGQAEALRLAPYELLRVC